MKIDNSTSKPVAGASTSPAKPARANSGKAPAAPQTALQDNVQLTPLSSQLQALESSLANVQVVDTARVEAIKQAISEGRFKINPDAVAERLLTSVKELVLKQNS